MNSNKKLEEEITELSKQWYQLISKDHHKDRDCHWQIATIWSYGDKPEYKILHHGYIHHNVEIGFKSYKDALSGLKLMLSKAIAKEKDAQALSLGL